jgi:ribosomal protein S6
LFGSADIEGARSKLAKVSRLEKVYQSVLRAMVIRMEHEAVAKAAPAEAVEAVEAAADAE